MKHIEYDNKHPFSMNDLRDKINEIVDYINAKEGVREEVVSEDERIKKSLVDFLWCIANGGMNNRGTMPSAEKCQEWLVWLEKQKPAEWSEEDEETWACIFEFCNRFGYDDACRLLKSLRPQPKWKPTEEQMINLRCAISGCSYDIEPLVELEEKLKKL